MTRHYKKYTDKDIIEKAKLVKSAGALIKSLGLCCTGGNYNQLYKNLQRLSIDTSHWTGQAWSKDIQLKDWKNYSRGINLKPHLIKLRGHKCESCNLETWLEKPIALELEHCDGDKTNNEETNLKLLCPNCHAQTPTWRRQKPKIK